MFMVVLVAILLFSKFYTFSFCFFVHVLIVLIAAAAEQRDQETMNEQNEEISINKIFLTVSCLNYCSYSLYYSVYYFSYPTVSAACNSNVDTGLVYTTALFFLRTMIC
jgi:hypothetical protein